MLSKEKVKDILFKLNMLGFEEEYDAKKDNLKSHLKRRCDDAVKGVGRSRMLWMTFFFIFILSFMTITAASIGYAQVSYPPQPTNCSPPRTDSDGNTRQTCKEGVLETLPSGAQFLDQGDISCNIIPHPLFCVKPRPDPPHCDRVGYPACYNVGYADGKIAGLLDGTNGIFYLFASPEHDCLDQSVNWCNGWKDGYRAGFLTNCGDSYRGCQSVNNNNNTAFAQTPNQSQIQNQSQNSKNNTIIDYTCENAGVNGSGIVVHCPPYPKSGTNCHLVNDGTPYPQFYDNCTPFFNHPQSNNYYNGYVNGSQEGLDQGFNAIDDPSDNCTTPPDPHDNWCKGWWQGWEDSWQFGCSHGGRKYYPDGDC